MANSIDLVTAFRNKADLIYKEASKTAFLDSMTEQNDHQQANEIKIFKISMVGMGNYSRANGYAAGDVTATWETIQLLYERGREFSVDNMDNEETLFQAFGRLSGEYIRTQVVPELDAARFARWAQTPNVLGETGSLTSAANVLAAIDAAAGEMDSAEVPMDGRILFISSTLHRLLNASISRSLANESTADRRLKVLDDMNIVVVPQARFFTDIAVNAGASASAGGFTSDGDDINFILMHPSAVWQAVKLNSLKVFSPAVNQKMDAWLLQHRLYHDGGVYDNKVDGVYVHSDTSSP